MTDQSFSSLTLHPALLSNLADLGYASMTTIQAQSLPKVLAGKDVIAQSKTGSGKTAAFGLGILQKLDVKQFAAQALILCPTRELADQVAKEIRRLARAIHNIKVLTLCGGSPFGPQLGSLKHGAHIIVGTPGRVEEHLRKGSLKADRLNTFVLDEADRMLEMGFQPALESICKKLPSLRQTLLFSATFPEQIEALSEGIMRSPARITVTDQHSNKTIEQHFYKVSSNEQRQEALQLLLLKYRPGSAVVFCSTRKETDELAVSLREAGFSALALHGELDQKLREQILTRFANKSASVLVATDVAARGLDIDALDAVFNYHLARDPEVHIHRIGRTGRAGASGLACSLVGDRETQKITRLEALTGQSVTLEFLPLPSDVDGNAYAPPMVCLQVDGGRKQKLRPGDIVGALTAGGDIKGDDVGKIHVFDNCAYVAVRRREGAEALRKLTQGKLKGRSFRARKIR